MCISHLDLGFLQWDSMSLAMRLPCSIIGSRALWIFSCSLRITKKGFGKTGGLLTNKPFIRPYNTTKPTFIPYVCSCVHTKWGLPLINELQDICPFACALSILGWVWWVWLGRWNCLRALVFEFLLLCCFKGLTNPAGINGYGVKVRGKCICTTPRIPTRTSPQFKNYGG